MNQKHQQNIYHANVNINLIAENLIQTKIGIKISVDVKIRQKYCVCKHIILGILVHVLVEMVNI